MTTTCCRCSSPRSTPTARRGLRFAAGALSIGVWSVIPKCPVCLAAYVTLWTGLGLSLTVATYLRWALLVVCVATLLFVVVRGRVRT